jgi:hypothetical protein
VKKECFKWALFKDSLFRGNRALTEFQPALLWQEMCERAPLLTEVLKAATGVYVQRGKKSTSVEQLNHLIMAAAIILKLRSKRFFTFLQLLVGSALYDGHASKRTYTRLQKFGVSASFNVVNRLVRTFGEGFDGQVMEWRSEAEATNDPPNYILVGDNVDKNVKPRFMRINRQVQSIHAWHQYAAINRFNLSAVAESLTLKDWKTVGVSEFLPTAEDTVSLRSNYITLVSCVLVDKLPFLHDFADVVPKHIHHILTAEMSRKSTTVPLGVIPRNENKNEELVVILEELMKYVPRKPNGEPHTCVVAGDQLTAERIYNIQLIRAASEDSVKRLDCFLPTFADWHTQVVYLQAMMDRLYSKGLAADGGTLLQLRNLVNRRSVAKDVSGRFNACVDFIETVVKCHIVAAALHHFNMKELTDRPSVNATQLINHSGSRDASVKWRTLVTVMGDIVDRYIILKDFVNVQGAGRSSL